MSATVEADRRVRTYGGRRRARGIGLFGVRPFGTAVVFACVVVPLMLAAPQQCWCVSRAPMERRSRWLARVWLGTELSCTDVTHMRAWSRIWG